MNEKTIKFISTNVAVIAIWAFVLFRHYTIIGLISFLSGSLLLFLSTLLDKDKSKYGISCKLDLYVFITFLSLFGMWSPFVFDNKFNFIFHENPKIAGIIVSFIAFFTFAIMSTAEKFSHYALRRIFKYVALLFLVLSVYYLFSFNLKQFVIIVPVVALFTFADIYVANMEKEKLASYVTSTTYKTYWMAFGTCALIIFLNIYCENYLNRFIGTYIQVENLLSNLLSGTTIAVFAIIMLALTAIFMYADGLNGKFNPYDSYLTISFGGFCLVLRTFLSNATIKTFVVIVTSLIVYVAIGFFIINLNKSKKTFLDKVLSKGKFAPIVFSVALTCASILSIILVYKGYLVSLVLLICGIVFIANSKKIFQGFWIANTMRWQMILVTISLVMGSVALINNNWDSSCSVLIFEFVISSLIMWSFGIRDGVWDNKFTVSKVADCVLLAGISLFAVL